MATLLFTYCTVSPDPRERQHSLANRGDHLRMQLPFNLETPLYIAGEKPGAGSRTDWPGSVATRAWCRPSYMRTPTLETARKMGFAIA